MSKKSPRHSLFIAVIALAFLVGASTAYAGSLTPPGAAADTMYTLTNLYNLSAGTTATLGSGTIPTTPSSVAASFYSLTQIYDAIAAQIATLANGKIASGISAFGYTGTLYGDTNAAKVLDTATYPGTITTNTLSAGSDTVSAGYFATTTLSAVDADLAVGNIKSGVNIFGKVGTVIQSLGDAVAANVLSGTTFSNATGANLSGTMPTNTLSAANDTVSAGYFATTTLSAVDADLAVGNIKSGTTIFGFAGTALSAQPLKTNQTICYDAAGAVVACAGTGQDGAYLKGVARSYTDPVNSTITDNATGLMWKKCSEGLSGAPCTTGTIATSTWNGALTQCEADTTASFTDWRLPNVYELYSLVDFGVASAPFINGTYFPATQSSYYWSSTTYPANYTNAMGVYFDCGGAGNGGKTNSYYVRCVRG